MTRPGRRNEQVGADDLLFVLGHGPLGERDLRGCPPRTGDLHDVVDPVELFGQQRQELLREAFLLGGALVANDLGELALGEMDAAPDHALQVRISKPARSWSGQDRKSTRLNSSHVRISYAVFC